MFVLLCILMLLLFIISFMLGLVGLFLFGLNELFLFCKGVLICVFIFVYYWIFCMKLV